MQTPTHTHIYEGRKARKRAARTLARARMCTGGKAQVERIFDARSGNVHTENNQAWCGKVSSPGVEPVPILTDDPRKVFVLTCTLPRIPTSTKAGKRASEQHEPLRAHACARAEKHTRNGFLMRGQKTYTQKTAKHSITKCPHQESNLGCRGHNATS